MISNLTMYGVCVFHAAVFGEMELFAVLWFLTGDWVMRCSFIFFCGIQTGPHPCPPHIKTSHTKYVFAYASDGLIKKLVDNSAQRNTKKSTKYAGTMYENYRSPPWTWRNYIARKPRQSYTKIDQIDVKRLFCIMLLFSY